MSREAPRIPDFELLRPIGEGSYGEVWIARSVTGAWRAVKIVKRDSFTSERPYEREFEGIQRFETVSRAQPNLVNVYHVGRGPADAFFYYVMELADGTVTGPEIDPANYVPRSLASDLEKHYRLGFDETLALGLAIAAALDHLHKAGLVHRDVKPGNVIYAAGVPKLADIGLVTSVNDRSSYVGTEGFLPPEGPGTARGDLFALGKVLYETVTGKDRKQFPMLPPDWMSDPDHARLMELNEVILRACEPDPRRCYREAPEMLRELALLQSGKSVRRLRAMERRMRFAIRAGAVAIILAVAAGAGWRSARQQIAATELTLKETKERLALTEAEMWLARAESGRPDSITPMLEAVKQLAGRVPDAVTMRSRLVGVLSGPPGGKSPDFLSDYTAPAIACAWVENGGTLVQISSGGNLLASLPDGSSREIPAAAPVLAIVGTDKGWLTAGTAGFHLTEKASPGSITPWDGLPGPAGSAAFSPDSAWVAAMEGHRAVVLSTDGSKRFQWELSPALPETALLACSPQGRWLILAGAGRLEARRGTDGQSGLSAPASRAYAAFSHDGSLCAVSADGQLTVYDVPAWTVLHQEHRGEAPGHAVAFSPDGGLLAWSRSASGISLLDVRNRWQSVVHLRFSAARESEFLTFSPDGASLAACGTGAPVRIWHLPALRSVLRSVSLDW